MLFPPIPLFYFAAMGVVVNERGYPVNLLKYGGIIPLILIDRRGLTEVYQMP